MHACIPVPLCFSVSVLCSDDSALSSSSSDSVVMTECGGTLRGSRGPRGGCVLGSACECQIWR